MSHVFTRVQQRQMHAPTSYGMHPEASRVLTSRGVDPVAFAHRVSSARGGSFDVGDVSGFSLGQIFSGPGGAAASQRPTGGPTRGARGVDPHRMGAFLRELGRTPYDRARELAVTRLGLDPGDTLVPELLTTGVLEWRNYNTLHRVVCPIQTETEASGTYLEYDRAGQRAVVDSRVGPNGQVTLVSRRVSMRNYTTQPRSLSGVVNRLSAALAPTFNTVASEVDFVSGMHDREQELDVARSFFTYANYPASNVVELGPGFQWNRGASADPVEDVLALMLNIPAAVTHAVFSDLAWSAVQINPQLQALLFGRFTANDGLVAPADFAMFFGIENVLVSKMLLEDAAGNVSRAWSETDLWMGHVSAARDALTFARRFRASLAGTNEGVSVRVAYKPEGPMGLDQVWVTRQDSEPFIVGRDFGGVIRNVRRPS